MKKLVKLLLCMTLVLALTGCGKEQSATYELETVQGNFKCVDTQTLKATGDIVYQMETTAAIDLSAMTEDEKAYYVELYKAYFDGLKEVAPATVTIEYTVSDNSIDSSTVMDIKNSDLQELIELGFVAGAGEDSDKIKMISFRQSCEALESMGFTLVE